MADFTTQVNTINAHRSTVAQKEKELHALYLRKQRGENITPAALQAARSQATTARNQLQTQVAVLHQGQTLDSLVKNWDPEIPLLMLPLRIQTRIVPNPQGLTQGNAHFALLVRIYPDDIFMCNHEEALTDGEIVAAKIYWNAIRLSEQAGITNDQKTEMKKEAWRQVCGQFGGGRSLYIARRTSPVNRTFFSSLTTETAIQYDPSVLSQTKSKSWSEAAKTGLLPDRFQVIVTGASATIVQNGNLVPDTLQLGLSPLDEAGAIKKSKGELTVGNEIKWMTDFAEAEKVGMGIRILLTPNIYQNFNANIITADGQARHLQSIGLRRIAVLGVLNSADKTKSAALLQQTFENQLYSRRSLAFVEKGTPTNNTDEGDSAWSIQNDPLSISYYDGLKNYDDTDTLSDGARLAKALGLAKSVFQNVPKSNKHDYTVARLLNTALYNASVGYYFEQLVNFIPNKAELESFFQDYVIGGGNYATIRVGYQPYGLALAGDYKKFDGGDKLAFYTPFAKVLSVLEETWQSFVGQIPRVGLGTNPADTLTDILSLHAQSQSFEQQWFYPTDNMTKEKVKDFDVLSNTNIELVRDYLATLGLPVNQQTINLVRAIPMSGLVAHLKRVSTTIPNDNLVRPEPFDSDDPLSIDGNFKPLGWLATVTSVRDIETLPQGSRAEVASLLFLFSRQALLRQLIKAVMEFVQLPIFKETDPQRLPLLSRQLTTAAGARSFNIPATSPTTTIWELLNTVLTIDTSHPATLRIPPTVVGKSIGDCVLSKSFITGLIKHFQTTPQPPVTTSQLTELLSLRAAFDTLADTPAATVEQAFIGHLDCASHRLDAWQEGLLARRLDQQRQKKPEGIYIGAFGWVEDLKMAQAAAQNDGGFIHAPSPTHATTAAVLKSAFMNHKKGSGQSAFALNLHSRRLQRAQEVLDSMQNGERLETILGYQFERELNDVSVKNNNAAANLIKDFRKQYRITSLQIPQNPTEKPTETASTQNIVNGLTLAEDAAWLAKIAPNATVKPFVQKAIDNLADTLDAVKDLLAAETAYRMAQGNFDAVGTTLAAVNKGRVPQDIGFTKSGRQDLLQFANRVTLHFDTEGVATNFPQNPRAQAEAGINKWCGQILGSLQKISAAVSHDAVPPSPTVPISLEELAIQPIDFVCLSANLTELEQRIAFAYRQKMNLGDDVAVKISFAESGKTGLRPIAQVLPLATTMQKLLTAARPLTAQDYLPNSGSETPSVIEAAELRGRIETVVNGIGGVLNSLKNIPLSQTLVLQDGGASLNTLGDVFAVLKLTKHELASEDWLPRVFANAAPLQTQLIQLANFGIAKAFPERHETVGAAAIMDLVRQALITVNATEQMLRALQSDLQVLAANTNADLTHAENLIRLGKQAMNGTMPMLPRFRYANAEQIKEANTRRAELLKGVATDLAPPELKAEEWLQSVARVRPKLAQWESLRFMANTLPLDLLPVQVPTDALGLKQADGSKKPIYTWLGAEFTEGVVIRKELVSIVVTGEAAAKTTLLQSGLLIDDWTEAIPTDEELTALTFHYNQPNTEAPQAMILAICPDAAWTWEAVVNALTDTFRRAKMRTVDISLIKEAAIGSNNNALKALDHLLPLLVAPVNVQQHTPTLDFGLANAKQRKITTSVSSPQLGHFQIWKE